MPHTLAAYADHEKLTAARMKWWGVYLIREQRRLQGIADRVRAQEAARAVGHPSVTSRPEDAEAILDEGRPPPDADDRPGANETL